MSASEHPIGARIPVPAEKPFIVCNPEELSELLIPDGAPRKPDDYLLTDTPLLGVVVTTFTDKTVIVIHWLHILSDALGVSAMVEAWLMEMQGRDDEILGGGVGR